MQRLIVRGLAQADLVACVSHLTQRALLTLNLAEERKVTTVLNGLNDDFSPVEPGDSDRLLAHFGLSAQDKFLIHVGSDLPSKNRKCVVEVFMALQRRAAIGGGPAMVQKLVMVGPQLTPEMAALAQREGLAADIHALLNVSHPELRALYARATALVFPSYQEGFGWPGIEAQACGCPVFTSNRAPMNEIAGDGAAYIDPDDPEAIAIALEGAASSLGEMRRLGFENSSQYTATRMTASYIETSRRVLADRRAPASQAVGP